MKTINFKVEFEKLAERFESERFKSGRASFIMWTNALTEMGNLLHVMHDADMVGNRLAKLVGFHFGKSKHPGHVAPSFVRCATNFALDAVQILAEEDDTLLPAAPVMMVALSDPAGAECDDMLARTQEEQMTTLAKACRRLAAMTSAGDGTISQATAARMLGVTAPQVSKLVKSRKLELTLAGVECYGKERTKRLTKKKLTDRIKDLDYSNGM